MPNNETMRLNRGQRKVLAALLQASGALTSSELAEATGLKKVTDQVRNLVDRGLVTTEKNQRPYKHSLTAIGKTAGGLQLEHRPPVTSVKTARESDLAPSQLLVLVVLMAEARTLSNEELTALAGFSLTGRDNLELIRRGLVETDRSHRPFSHQLTDKGWHLVRELHTTPPPRAGGSAIQSLFTLLANLHRALDRIQISHADFFRQSGNTPSQRLHAHSETDIQERIRATYQDLARAPGEWVGLADLRERLADIERSAVDVALASMRRNDDVRLIPIANSKALKPRDHAAALRIGDSDVHAMAIGRP